MTYLNKSVGVLTFFILFSFNSYCQTSIVSFGNLYIGEDAEFTIFKELIFANNNRGISSGIINTNKNPKRHGVVLFTENGEWADANGHRYIDGYVKALGNRPFLYPIGHLGSYRPIALSSANGTKATYQKQNPFDLEAVRNNFSPSHFRFSQNEYWIIDGSHSTDVTFTWNRESMLSELIEDDLTKLCLVGWTGTAWKKLESSLEYYNIQTANSEVQFSSELSNIYKGALTVHDLVPNEYEYYTFGVELDHSWHPEEELQSLSENIQFSVFPNPANSLADVWISYDLTHVYSSTQLSVHNEKGQLVFKSPIKGKSVMKLPFITHISGVYTIQITSEAGTQESQRIVVTRL